MADNTAATVRLTNDNAAAMTQSLGRAPSPGELYLAHQQGAAGAAALLQNPGANAAQALSLAYGGDIGKAINAIKVNGGDPNGTAGQFAGKWVNKFEGGTGGAGQSQDGSPVVAYSGLLRESYAAFNAHAEKLWGGMTANGWDKGFAPTPAEMTDLRTMAPYITDPALRQTIQTRLQIEGTKDNFAKMPLAQQQDMVAAGQAIAEKGGLDNVQRQTLTALDAQVRHQVTLAQQDPVTYGQRFIPPDAKGGLSPIAQLDLGSPQGFAAALRSRQAIKGAAQKMDPSVGDMPFSGTDRDQIVAALQSGSGGQVGTILDGMSSGLTIPEMTAVTGDEKLRNAIIGNARSADPGKVASAYAFLGQQYAAAPAAFEHRFPGVQPDLLTWQTKTAYQPPQLAAQQMIDAQTPQGIAAREAAKADAEPYFKTLNLGKISAMVSGASNMLQSSGAPTGSASSALESEFRSTYRDLYARIGDQAQAEQLTVQDLRRSWTRSAFNGGNLMKNAPENVINPKTRQPFYPEVAGNRDYITDQMDDEVNEYVQHAYPSSSMSVQGAEARPMLSNRHDPLDPFGLFQPNRQLWSDSQTDDDVAHGRPPSYLMMVTERDGRIHALPDLATGLPKRIYFDPKPAQAEALEHAEAKRRAYFDNQTLPAMGPM